MNDDVAIRSAVESDSHALAELLVRAWQWAYRGMIPEGHLMAFEASVLEKDRWFRRQLREAEAEWRTWVVESGERLLGFAVTGPSRDPDANPGIAEVWGIYMHQSVVGTGIGRVLFKHSVDDLRGRGYEFATLWVLEANTRARRFYESAGWNLDGGTQTERRSGLELHEARYRVNLALPPP